MALFGLAALILLVGWLGLFDRSRPLNLPAAFKAHPLEVDASLTVRRANDNYSVIPGGAFTGEKFTAAVNRDAVVAQHYSDVDPSTMRPEILEADRLAYVSYRRGDRVFWTSQKVGIRSGETILTNGETEIRACCGNRISMEPLMPTSADEPDAMQLEGLIDTDRRPLDARDDTSPVLVAWPFNPPDALVAGGSAGVELPPVLPPQVGLPLFPVSAGLPTGPLAGGPGDPVLGELQDAALAITRPIGVTPPLSIGPNVPGFPLVG